MKRFIYSLLSVFACVLIIFGGTWLSLTYPKISLGIGVGLVLLFLFSIFYWNVYGEK